MTPDSTSPAVLNAAPVQEPSWSLLVQRIRAGDPAGMEQLYAVFSKGVRYFLWRQLGTNDLDDKVHDIFLIVTQSIRRGDLREPERLMGYVRTVLRRQVAAYIEQAVHIRRNEVEMGPALNLTDREISPERRIVEKETQEVAMRVLRSLPARDREVLARFYLEEQSAEQICRDMQLTETQFRLIKSRAKARYGELGKRRFAQRKGFQI
jgi:RNA polymerase sigma factor (sigma-70 family)